MKKVVDDVVLYRRAGIGKRRSTGISPFELDMIILNAIILKLFDVSQRGMPGERVFWCKKNAGISV